MNPILSSIYTDEIMAISAYHPSNIMAISSIQYYHPSIQKIWYNYGKSWHNYGKIQNPAIPIITISCYSQPSSRKTISQYPPSNYALDTKFGLCHNY